MPAHPAAASLHVWRESRSDRRDRYFDSSAQTRCGSAGDSPAASGQLGKPNARGAGGSTAACLRVSILTRVQSARAVGSRRAWQLSSPVSRAVYRRRRFSAICEASTRAPVEASCVTTKSSCSPTGCRRLRRSFSTAHPHFRREFSYLVEFFVLFIEGVVTLVEAYA